MYIGVNWAVRKIAPIIKPELIWEIVETNPQEQQNDSKTVRLTNINPIKKQVTVFTIDEEFEETFMDGSRARVCLTIMKL